jgi:hypothetical protein
LDETGKSMKAMGLTLVKQDCWPKILTLTELEISIVLAVAILGQALAVMASGDTQKRRIRTTRSIRAPRTARATGARRSSLVSLLLLGSPGGVRRSPGFGIAL